MSNPNWRVSLLVVVVGILSGCGGEQKLSLVPVSGQVTFAGGPCPYAGSITFSPVSNSIPAGALTRPGRATFNADGKFVASSFKQGDGLLPATYEVKITCLEGEPGVRPFDEVNQVPKDYRPEQLVVKEGGEAMVVNFDVPPKK